MQVLTFRKFKFGDETFSSTSNRRMNIRCTHVLVADRCHVEDREDRPQEGTYNLTPARAIQYFQKYVTPPGQEPRLHAFAVVEYFEPGEVLRQSFNAVSQKVKELCCSNVVPIHKLFVRFIPFLHDDLFIVTPVFKKWLHSNVPRVHAFHCTCDLNMEIEVLDL